MKKVKVAQLCLTLCGPMGYIAQGILQARILEWVAFPFSRESSQPTDWTQVSCIAGGFFTSWTTNKEGSPLQTPFPDLSYLPGLVILECSRTQPLDFFSVLKFYFLDDTAISEALIHLYSDDANICSPLKLRLAYSGICSMFSFNSLTGFWNLMCPGELFFKK